MEARSSLSVGVEVVFKKTTRQCAAIVILAPKAELTVSWYSFLYERVQKSYDSEISEIYVWISAYFTCGFKVGCWIQETWKISVSKLQLDFSQWSRHKCIYVTEYETKELAFLLKVNGFVFARDRRMRSFLLLKTTTRNKNMRAQSSAMTVLCGRYIYLITSSYN